MIYEIIVGEKAHRVELARTGTGWQCKLDGREFRFDATQLAGGVISLLVGGTSYQVHQEDSPGESNIVVGRERFPVQVRDPRSLRSRGPRSGPVHGVKKITAPMPGKVVRVLASVGSEIQAGQPVIVIEAMKMQNELKAPKKGKIVRLNTAEGAAVEAGEVLAEVE